MLRTALLAAATLKYSATHAAPFECNIHDARISLYIAVRTSDLGCKMTDDCSESTAQESGVHYSIQQ